MAMIPDAIVGAVVGELLKAVLDMKDKAVKFKPTLDSLEITLKSIEPLVNQIDNLNKQLDRPKEETERLIDQMKSGKKLVLECSKIQWWKFCCRANYQEKLQALDESIIRFFNLDVQAQMLRNGLETQVELKDFRAEFRSMVRINQRVELRGVCSPPEPPVFTVGLDVLLKELKFEYLRDHVSVSVITVTGTEGSGKSTFAKKFCWDEQVRGKFRENIFFITFGKTPKLSIIAQKLLQHTSYQVPEFQSDDDAIHQLEILLKQIGKNPILLVLDDVWPGSESLIDKFVFQIPNYLILVASRIAIERYGTPYILKPLDQADAITLFKQSASINERTSDIADEVVKKIVEGCSGSPMALTVIGKLLINKNPVVWHNRARELSEGHSILESSNELLACLQKGFDVLEPKATECFRDLSLFPEDQRIPAAALVDMWAELHGEDEATAMENIFELAYRNLADIFIIRKVASDTVDYNYHYVTQHNLLRELAFRQINQEPVDKRNRVIIDLSGNNLPIWWTKENEYSIAARVLSISTDETFNSEWCNLQPTEVEVLVLNLREQKCTLPKFMEKMNKLKVLIITNYDFYRAELENFELLDCLSDLKRIRLEKVSIPFLSKTGVPLKNLQKFSFFMCNINEAFQNSTAKVPAMLPNLVEINIDYCDLVELPLGISYIVQLKKLSITNCHKLSSLPEGIGKLVNLESLSLSSCTGLKELPDSITKLQKLKFLDISDCKSLNKYPENMGNLVNLKKLNVRGCSRLRDLPYSVTDLVSLREVVCDEERAAFWEPFTSILSDLKVEVVQAEINLNWLL